MVIFLQHLNADASHLFDDLDGLRDHIRTNVKMCYKTDLIRRYGMTKNTPLLQLRRDLTGTAPLLYFEDNDIGLHRHNVLDKILFPEGICQLLSMPVIFFQPL